MSCFICNSIKKKATCGKSLDAALIERITKRPFWAAPLLRREFGAKRRIAQGRLCRPRAFQCRRVELPAGRRNPKKKHLLNRCFFFGSGRRIRTLTNRVRVCRATLTQSRYFFVLPCGLFPCRKDRCYYTKLSTIVNSFFKIIFLFTFS